MSPEVERLRADFRVRASEKRAELAGRATPATLNELLAEILVAVKALTERPALLDRENPAPENSALRGKITFSITERDADGKIKSFVVEGGEITGA